MEDSNPTDTGDGGDHSNTENDTSEMEDGGSAPRAGVPPKAVVWLCCRAVTQLYGCAVVRLLLRALNFCTQVCAIPHYDSTVD